jgi:HSP20 family protein
MSTDHVLKKAFLSSLLLTAFAVSIIADTTTEKAQQPTQCEWDCHGWWFPSIDEIFSRSLFVRPVTQYHSSMSFKETGTSYTVNVELPGIEKKDISVNVINNVLIIAAKRTVTEKTKDKTQKSYSSYDQSIVLPENADINKINAVFKKDALTVTIPKTGKKTAKKITIH